MSLSIKRFYGEEISHEGTRLNTKKTHLVTFKYLNLAWKIDNFQRIQIFESNLIPK